MYQRLLLLTTATELLSSQNDKNNHPRRIRMDYARVCVIVAVNQELLTKITVNVGREVLIEV